MDAREFTIRFMSLSDSLYRVAWYMLESESDAQDAVQDLFVKLWNNKDNLDGINNPKAYCIMLLKNQCIDRIRQARHRQATELDESIASECDISTDINRREELDRVMEAIERLPDRERQVLKMRTIEGLSYEEMSEKTGMNNLTLRVVLSQARKKLKSLI